MKFFNSKQMKVIALAITLLLTACGNQNQQPYPTQYPAYGQQPYQQYPNVGCQYGGQGCQGGPNYGPQMPPMGPGQVQYYGGGFVPGYAQGGGFVQMGGPNGGGAVQWQR